MNLRDLMDTLDADAAMRGNSADYSPTRGNSADYSPTRTEVRSPTSTSTEVRSPTSTSTEVRSPTSTSTEVRSPTSTSTDAYTSSNVTVTGGAGAGANTTVNIYGRMPVDPRAGAAGRARLVAERFIDQTGRAALGPRPEGIPATFRQDVGSPRPGGMPSALHMDMAALDAAEQPKPSAAPYVVSPAWRAFLDRQYALYNACIGKYGDAALCNSLYPYGFARLNYERCMRKYGDASLCGPAYARAVRTLNALRGG